MNDTTIRKTYNHAFSVGFAVSGCFNEDPMATLRREKDKVIAALLERIVEILHNDVEYMEACDPFDTYGEVHGE